MMSSELHENDFRNSYWSSIFILPLISPRSEYLYLRLIFSDRAFWFFFVRYFEAMTGSFLVDLISSPPIWIITSDYRPSIPTYNFCKNGSLRLTSSPTSSNNILATFYSSSLSPSTTFLTILSTESIIYESWWLIILILW